MYSNLLTHATLTSLCARIIVFVLDSKEKAYYRKLALLIGYYGYNFVLLVLYFRFKMP